MPSQERYGVPERTIAAAIQELPADHADRVWLEHVHEHIATTPFSVVAMAVRFAQAHLGEDVLALGAATPPPLTAAPADTDVADPFPSVGTPASEMVIEHAPADPPVDVSSLQAEDLVVSTPQPAPEPDLPGLGADPQESDPGLPLTPAPTPQGGVFGAVPQEVLDSVYATEDNGRVAIPLVLPDADPAVGPVEPPVLEAPLPPLPPLPPVAVPESFGSADLSS